MSALPRTFKIVRNGVLEDVRVNDVNSTEKLIQLRTELELIRLCGLGADEQVRSALEWMLLHGGDDDLEDLYSVLNDAAHPTIAVSIARIDREWPDIRRQFNQEVIRETSGRFRRDVADRIRNSGLGKADELAAAYEKRVRVLARSGLLEAGGANPTKHAMSDSLEAGPTPQPDGDDSNHASDACDMSTTEEEDVTMTDQTNATNTVDDVALAKDIDEAINTSAKAAADDIEATLHAAVQEADKVELADPTAEVDAILNDPTSGAEQEQHKPQTARKAPVQEAANGKATDRHANDDNAVNDAPPETENADAPSEDALDAAVQEADKAEIEDSNAEIDAVLSDAVRDSEQTEDEPEQTPLPSAQEAANGEAADQPAEVDRAPNEKPDAAEQPDVPSTEALQAAVREAVEAEVTDLNAEICGFLDDALASVDDIATAVRSESAADDVGLTPPTYEELSEPARKTPGEQPTSVEDSVGGLPSREPPRPPSGETPTVVDTTTNAIAAPASPAARAPEGMDDIEKGLCGLAHFLTGEVQQLWSSAKEAMSQARAFRDEAEKACSEARWMYAEIQAMQKEIAEAREQTVLHRRETRNCRDDVQKALERTRLVTRKAANAADQALSEARDAAAYAQQARRAEAPTS